MDSGAGKRNPTADRVTEHNGIGDAAIDDRRVLDAVGNRMIPH
jgi:hypothetical protein